MAYRAIMTKRPDDLWEGYLDVQEKFGDRALAAVERSFRRATKSRTDG